ncbi:MAG: hypothetical protein ACKV2Q_09295 [Planctomycetaceae bacterium]
MPDISWLSLLTNLQRATSGDEIDAALRDIQRAAQQDFINGLARKLARVPRHGDEAILEDAETILNDVLMILWRKSRSFRGTCDEEAQAWVRRIIGNRLRDAIKTPNRRGQIWQAVMDYLRGRAERQAGRGQLNNEDGDDET